MMHLEWRVPILSVFALLLCACQPIVAPAEMTPAEEMNTVSAPSTTLDPMLVTKIEALVEQVMEESSVPGVAVGIVKDGKLVYAGDFGVADLDSDKQVTPESTFQWGSVGKSFVGVATMQLVEEGKIDLDKPVKEYLPYFTAADPEAEEITVRQLLSHTSGMPNFEGWVAEYRNEDRRADEGALEDYVRSLRDESLLFLPGEDWSYSTAGYDILGDVVAKVSGQSFEDYVQDQILTPLGMEDSSFLLSDVDSTQLVAPHMYDEEGNAKTIDFFPYSRTHAPAEMLFSSVKDMAHFAVANMNHGELGGVQMLPASAYEEMWSPHAASPWAEAFGPQVSNYGPGWWVGNFNGQPLIGNYGTEYGYQSHLGILTDQGIAVIAVVNIHDPEMGRFDAYDIGNGVAELLLSVEE